MITKALNLPSTNKTAEIMSRYRPIAPKPDQSGGQDTEDNGESIRIKQSPYLQSVWPQLQARPTRTRKRGRTALAPPPPIKRPRAEQFVPVFGPSSIPPVPIQTIINYCEIPNKIPLPVMQALADLNGRACMEARNENGLDLNKVPEEKDLIAQLQAPVSHRVFMPQPIRPVVCPRVILPQPIRLIGSSINVGYINGDGKGLDPPPQIRKKRHEVEDEVELEALPAVISDTNNKVRLANSAYKEMVGQPVCPWLTIMAQSNACKTTRICGKVMLQFSNHATPPSEALMSSSGFSAWATIEWVRPDGENEKVRAFCDVIKLACENEDYAFEWKFHTSRDKHNKA